MVTGASTRRGSAIVRVAAPFLSLPRAWRCRVSATVPARRRRTPAWPQPFIGRTQSQCGRASRQGTPGLLPNVGSFFFMKVVGGFPLWKSNSTPRMHPILKPLPPSAPFRFECHTPIPSTTTLLMSIPVPLPLRPSPSSAAPTSSFLCLPSLSLPLPPLPLLLTPRFSSSASSLPLLPPRFFHPATPCSRAGWTEDSANARKRLH